MIPCCIIIQSETSVSQPAVTTQTHLLGVGVGGLLGHRPLHHVDKTLGVEDALLVPAGGRLLLVGWEVFEI